MSDAPISTDVRSQTTRFFDRAMRNLRTAWRDISVTARGAIAGSPAVAPALPDGDVEKVRQRIRDCLEGRGGEVSARARAAELGRLYLSFSPDGRKRFLKLL